MINGIELKKFKEIEGHGDSRTFSAQVWIDGVNAGMVMNDGRGGCNDYQFYNHKDLYKVFMDRCKLWGKENSVTFEPEDAFVEELIATIEYEKVAKTNLKKGFMISILCRKDKEIVYGNTFWNKEWIVGLKSKDQIEDYIKKDKVEEWKII